MNDQEMIKVLKDSGAMLDGHFLLTSGRHSNVYIEKFRLLENPIYLDMVCNMCIDISYHFKNYQYTLYGGTISLLSYRLHSLINWVRSPNEKYIFEDYVLGKNSPRRLNIKKKNIN